MQCEIQCYTRFTPHDEHEQTVCKVLSDSNSSTTIKKKKVYHFWSSQRLNREGQVTQPPKISLFCTATTGISGDAVTPQTHASSLRRAGKGVMTSVMAYIEQWRPGY